jgi:hypothetical protein
VQWTNEERQEWLDYVFQHNYYRVEQAAKRLEKKGGQFSPKISSKKGEAPRSEYTVPNEDATMEFGLAISRFALLESWYNVDHWLRFLRDLSGERHFSEFDKMERRLQQIREGRIALTLNQHNITDFKAYEMLARRVFFVGDLAANAYKQWLLNQGQIIYNTLWQKYNSYCIGLWSLMQEVHDYRKKHGIGPPPVRRETICIYCKGTEGDFGHVEHILPESLGNEYNFLPKGFVCVNCMVELNKLEDGIHEMPVFSLPLVTTGIGNKKGKLPYLKSSQLHIQKKSPNMMTLNSLGKKALKEEPMEGGEVKVTLTPSGPFDVHRIARMLYKAALGDIALKLCRHAALDSKFNEIRRYIIKGGTFPNNMMIFKKGHPSLPMGIEWYEVEGVLQVKLIVLGRIFFIMLGERPKLNPVDELKPHVIMFDLSLEKPKGSS